MRLGTITEVSLSWSTKEAHGQRIIKRIGSGRSRSFESDRGLKDDARNPLQRGVLRSVRRVFKRAG